MVHDVNALDTTALPQHRLQVQPTPSLAVDTLFHACLVYTGHWKIWGCRQLTHQVKIEKSPWK